MGCTPSQHSSQAGVNYNQASDLSVCDSCASSGQAVDHREGNAVRPSATNNPEQESLCRRLKGNIFLTDTSKGQQPHDQVWCLFIDVVYLRDLVHTDNTRC
ncbi:hypothetical protein LSAT2_007495 [Lamellibrachia satsuma]|nr:hypothetical protein LSAT2_007495 [Lamellibrachia satsuma]